LKWIKRVEGVEGLLNVIKDLWGKIL